MQANTAVTGTADLPSCPSVTPLDSLPQKYSDEMVRQLATALEEPFDPTEIKWRVTNTTSDRRRGQIIAYADPRAYTDRLNGLFTVRGWTREYSVQAIQNFERRSNGDRETTISGKIVVTCRLTIDGLGSHSGLGEEWADNENAGTSAEAQAFKRACSCFGLGRYLYDLGGNWVDLDDRRQPLSKPKLPNWALPKNKRPNSGSQNGTSNSVSNGQRRDESADVSALKALVKALCERVGAGLAKSVTTTVAGVESPDQVSDVGTLGALVEKLEDTLRGVERLRTAAEAAGTDNLPQMYQEAGFTGDCLDDIPDRRILRQLIETFEKAAKISPAVPDGNGHRNGHCPPVPIRPGQRDANPLGAARADLIREAQRVGKVRRMRVSEVVDRSARGAFRFADLQKLSSEAVPALQAATELLRQIV
jgi:hypothetical protein